MLTTSWEKTLLAWAHEVLDNQAVLKADAAQVDEVHLERAYAHCDGLTRLHSRTFHLASGLLPPPKRRAARALYAFCRITDDIVDHAQGKPADRLEAWRCRALAVASGQLPGGALSRHKLVMLAWADTRARYSVPWGYVEQLIEGVARDIHLTRYNTFDELATYCYRVASTVGLMAMHIIGYAGTHAIPYAIKLGVALQLTNILRDVAEDWRLGRLYLPQEELAAFNLSEADIASGQVSDRWRAFMRFQIARAHHLYAEAMPGIALLNREGRFAIAAAAELYQAILDDIEAHDADVFSRRAHVGVWGKLLRLPGIWLHSLGHAFSRPAAVPARLSVDI